MTEILHVKGSPNRGNSHSEAAAQALIDALANELPSSNVDTIDVWDLMLPEFDATMIQAKFAVLRAGTATDEQRRQWAQAVRIAERFNRADLYVFSLPMWNFGIPYRLKHFIDVATLPGQNWTWSREHGYTPLLRNKRAVLVLSSANAYEAEDASANGTSSDFQGPYMRRWLRFIGIEVIKEIHLRPTLADPARVAAVKAEAAAEAVEFARSFPLASSSSTAFQPA